MANPDTPKSEADNPETTALEKDGEHATHTGTVAARCGGLSPYGHSTVCRS